MDWPSIVKVGRPVAEAGTGVVMPLTTRAEAGVASEYVVPDMVRAEPGESVCPAMIYCEALFAVMIWPPVVMAGRPVGNVRGIVVPPITTFDADGARLMIVPETVIADPGDRV